MCLPIKVMRPQDVLAEGTHMGFEWIVTNNGNGYRCGYVKVEPGHPWYGLGYDELYDRYQGPSVHGGLTFAERDMECGKGGPDDGWWFGFDCAHGGDAQDRTLPHETDMSEFMFLGRDAVVRTQEYVEAECRKLCEQAFDAAQQPQH